MPDPIITQIDLTRDLKGTFFVVGDPVDKYEELMCILEKKFKTKLKTNHNSFSSCFQYVERPNSDKLYRRFKVYGKTQ